MTGLTGTVRLTRLALRRDRVTLPAWIGGLTVFLAVTTAMFVDSLRTELDIDQEAQLSTVNPGLRMLGLTSGPSVGGATLVLLVPSIPGWSGDPQRSSLAELSVPVSIVLLLAYVGLTWYSLRRHAALHIASDEEITGWSLRLALGVLGLATVATALVAEILVAALETFAEKAGLTEFFVAAVIVAIVGNAAEHGGAVVVAARGKIALAAEIALASSAQVAVFLIPAVALLSWLIDPLALSFREVEIAVLGASVAFTSLLLFRGRSTRLRGVVLVGAYVAAAAAFYAAGDR